MKAVASTPFRRRLPKRLALGSLLVATLCLVAVLAFFWTPYPPTQIAIASRFSAPLERGLLGTDHFGRDVLSLLMAGAWNSLSVAVTSVAIGGLFGAGLGIAVASVGGALDRLLMRICDVLFAFPPIVSVMMLGVFLGPGRASAITAIAVFMIPVFARVARASARQVLAQPYVMASRNVGRSEMGLCIHHVVPNIVGQLAVQAAIQIGLALLTEAGLSFLGLGAPPPAPSWGRMLAESQTYLTQAPWLALAPGAAIALAVLGFNLMGDGLRDLFDPRRREARRT